MSVVTPVVDGIVNQQGIAAYCLIGGLAFGESGLLLGFVLPGETAVFLGGVLASRGGASLPLMATVAIVAAVAGDVVGFELGRWFGPRIRRSKVLTHRQTALLRSEDLVRRHGGKAVLLGRFTAFLRALTPGVAGMAGMPYRTFLPWNLAGAVVWAGGLTLLGSAAGSSYSAVEVWLGRGSLVLAVVLLVGVIGVVIRRRVTAAPAAAGLPPPAQAE